MAHLSSPLKQTILWLAYALLALTFPTTLSFAPTSPGSRMIRRSLSNLISRYASRNVYERLPSSAITQHLSSFRSQHLSLLQQGNARINSRGFSSKLSELSATLVDEESADTSSSSLFSENIEVNGSALDNAESGLFQGLTSSPVKGGNWNPKAPVVWAKDFGRRSPEYEEQLKSLIHLKEGDEGYFDASDLEIPKVTSVRTKEEAKIVMEKLMNADPNILHACDTEVMNINLKEVGPIGNGYVTCASVYSGPEFDYGLGQGPGTTLWIDNLDDACGVLQEFKDWFEDPTKYKVWHNYGFDRHVMWNEGIDCQGFGGDTMHMARLQDTSRAKSGEGYSLEALTANILEMRKRPMKEIFGVPRLRKDGTPGSMVDVPAIEILQRDPKFRKNFILYSCYDAEGTWRLHEKLKERLQQMSWLTNGKNLYDYYWENMREFGKVLTDMERRGISVDAKDYLASVELQARKDRVEHSKKFRTWAAGKIGTDGLALNPASSLQLGAFLFGGAMNQKTKERTEKHRVFKVKREEIPEDALAAYKKRDEEDKASKDGRKFYRHSFLCKLWLVLYS
jgi:hypothetical protein